MHVPTGNRTVRKYKRATPYLEPACAPRAANSQQAPASRPPHRSLTGDATRHPLLIIPITGPWVPRGWDPPGPVLSGGHRRCMEAGASSHIVDFKGMIYTYWRRPATLSRSPRPLGWELRGPPHVQLAQQQTNKHEFRTIPTGNDFDYAFSFCRKPRSVLVLGQVCFTVPAENQQKLS